MKQDIKDLEKRVALFVCGTINNHSNRFGNNKNRNVIWFNPPFCKLTKINIGKYFLDLLDKYFNKDNPLSKIFNGNTIKISYSCTNNIYKILNNHNRKLLDELNKNNERTNRVPCNCRKKNECPLDGLCNSENLVYQACISPIEHNTDGKRIYPGISVGNQKQTV